jgi:NADPH:quinone reductase-like Zn-dependent oxidoreductase
MSEDIMSKESVKNIKVIIRKPGSADVCEIVEEQLAFPGDDQVMIKVEYCGVAFGDILFREGISPASYPITPGYDVVGHIVATGANVRTVKIDDRVAAMTLTGGYSSYVCIDRARIVPVPLTVDSRDAVSVLLNYVTAYQLLVNKARVSAGNKILIHGAGGGVGLAVLDLARMLKITAYGTVSTTKINDVKAAGGIPIDYTSEDFVEAVKAATGTGVDAVFDPIGGKHLFRSYRALNKHGRLVIFGVADALKTKGNVKWRLMKAILPLLWLKILPNSRSVMLYSTNAKTQGIEPIIEKLLMLLEFGEIKPVICKIFPLTKVVDAQNYLTDERPAGKILLKP